MDVNASEWQLALGLLAGLDADGCSGYSHWACSAEDADDQFVHMVRPGGHQVEPGGWAQPQSMIIPCGTEPGSSHEDQVPIGQSPPHVAHNSGGFTLIASMVDDCPGVTLKRVRLMGHAAWVNHPTRRSRALP